MNDFSEFDFPTGSTVPFPYPNPYPQQIALMDTMLQSLCTLSKSKEHKGAAVWMLESPTGTGKSLSLACASMTWLRYRERLDLSEAETEVEEACSARSLTTIGPTAVDDWISNWKSPQEREEEEMANEIMRTARQARVRLHQELESLQKRATTTERRLNLLRTDIIKAKMISRKLAKKRKRKQASTGTEVDQYEDFCVPDYRSDDDIAGRSRAAMDENAPNAVSSSTAKDASSFAAWLLSGHALDGSSVLLGKSNGSLLRLLSPIGQVTPGAGVRKIIYAARTHTQLSQFVSELKRTHWGSDVRVVALGGRKGLCGHAKLKKKSETALNEACLDLKKSSTESCPLLSSQAAVDTLALHSLVEPTDIEELSRLGESMQTCAYYASRSALAAAEVVVLPYSMLLSKQTRKSIGLSLKQALVIVDEAHNLPEALRALHSCRLTLPIIESALSQLGLYVAKYAHRLAGRNLHHLGQIRRLLLAFQKYLKRSKPLDHMVTSTELMMEMRLDNLNLFKIVSYLERSRLAQKLLGFTNHQKQQEDENGIAKATEETTFDGLSKHVSAMAIVQSFLEKLTTSGEEGKIVLDLPSQDSRHTQHPTFRYVLLNPATFFKNVLEDAYALALVGGTLRPFVHVAAELLGSDNGDGSILRAAAKADESMQSSDKVSNSLISPNFSAFTCDHVVSSSNVLLQCICAGPSGTSLDFRHRSRTTDAVCDELGRTLLQVCRTVPSGVVVFLPSYSYEAHLVNRWRKTGLWQGLSTVKNIHREPKSSQNIDVSLQAFAANAEKGAVLFSVIGGKLSEGINFSNDMARCVLVVGLPYPDITDPELKEKMSSMDRSSSKSITGQAYYHNLCMRAVNQSVGRAIRHANDYAAILLVDQRYQTDNRVWSSIPNWVKKGAFGQRQQPHPFEQRVNELAGFFERKKNAKIGK